jgi:cytochrome c-type biogenesis protein CcmH/NrfF
MSFVIAGHFLTGAILTWALPIALLAIVGLYWALVLSRTDLSEELDEAATDPDAR